MPLYMSTFDYKPEVWSELIHNPENRTETVSQLLESAGCKLKGLWYAFGKSDGFALIEAPDNVTSASLAIAISASGAFRKFETTVLITQDDLLKALEAGNRRAAGALLPVAVRIEDILDRFRRRYRDSHSAIVLAR